MRLQARGFTLIEMILSLAVVAILAGAAFVFSRTIIIDADLDAATTSFVESTRRAQMLSRASDGDNTWGVIAQSGSIVLFRGSSYTSRDAAYDGQTTVPTTIVPSGTTEFVFVKRTGFPSSSGALTLTGPQGQSRTISINAKGTVSY